MLFNYLVDFAKNFGANVLELDVWEFNKEAFRFYEEMWKPSQEKWNGNCSRGEWNVAPAIEICPDSCFSHYTKGVMWYEHGDCIGIIGECCRIGED